MSSTARIRVVDSHTGGEPTRVVFGGAPDLGTGTVAERATRFAREHSAFRRAVVCEPRGFDAMVGALLVEPDDPTSDAAVIFFNDVGPLGMCGHGTIGLVRTLDHLGRATTERLTIETPAGKVTTERTGAHSVRVANVPSRRHAVDVSVEVPGYGTFVGDVAWGGNWFFLARTPAGVDLRGENVLELTVRARAVRAALAAAGITGAGGAEIDHVEFFARPEDPANDSRNFVLCPGGAFDRSPCGTGTSAKLACLAADGKLAPGALWRQESVIGSVFQASYDAGEDGSILPHIEGSAHVTAEGELLLDLDDPYHAGIPGLSGALPPRADER